MLVACIGERHEHFHIRNSKTNFRGRGTSPHSGSRDLILVSAVICLTSPGLISPAAWGWGGGEKQGDGMIRAEDCGEKPKVPAPRWIVVDMGEKRPLLIDTKASLLGRIRMRCCCLAQWITELTRL
jgi:hypothetical protein